MAGQHACRHKMLYVLPILCLVLLVHLKITIFRVTEYKCVAGNPKGVVLTHHTLVTAVASLQGFVDLGNIKLSHEDSFLSFLTLAHIFDRVVEEFILSVGGHIGYWQVSITSILTKMLSPTSFSMSCQFLVVTRIADCMCLRRCNPAMPLHMHHMLPMPCPHTLQGDLNNINHYAAALKPSIFAYVFRTVNNAHAACAVTHRAHQRCRVM